MYIILATVAIIVVILLLIYFLRRPRGPQFIFEDDINYVWGKALPGQNSTDGKIVYLGKTDTSPECVNKCFETPGCKANTWHNPYSGDYAYSCYGMAKPEQRVIQRGVTSVRRS